MVLSLLFVMLSMSADMEVKNVDLQNGPNYRRINKVQKAECITTNGLGKER